MKNSLLKFSLRKIFNLLPKSITDLYYNRVIEKENERIILKWKNEGKPLPPPEIIKRRVISKIRDEKGYEVLIETGTYLGDMIQAQLNNFKKLYTIELSIELFEKAKIRFKKHSKVNLLQGDSGVVLNNLLPTINESCIFWLDGHYSGIFKGVQTAKGDKECPIYEELNAIFRTNFNHYILIDDARMFKGSNDYPTIQELIDFVLTNRPNSLIHIEDDLIYIDLLK